MDNSIIYQQYLEDLESLKKFNTSELLNQLNTANQEIENWNNMSLEEFNAERGIEEQYTQELFDEIKKDRTEGYSSSSQKIETELNKIQEEVLANVNNIKEDINYMIEKNQTMINELLKDKALLEKQIAGLDVNSSNFAYRRDEYNKKISEIAVELNKRKIYGDSLREALSKVGEFLDIKDRFEQFNKLQEMIEGLDSINLDYNVDVMQIDIVDLDDGNKKVNVAYKGRRFTIPSLPADKVNRENILAAIQKSVLAKMGENDLAKVNYNGHELTDNIKNINVASVLLGSEQKTETVTNPEPQPSANQNDLSSDDGVSLTGKNTSVDVGQDQVVPKTDGAVQDAPTTGNYEYVLNEEATMKNYFNEYNQNADGWYFDPSTDEYVEGYNPLTDPLFQAFDTYEIKDVVDEEATMRNYFNEYTQNAFGWYFDPSTDEYVEGYNPLTDPLFIVTKQEKNFVGIKNATQIGNVTPSMPNPGEVSPTGGNDAGVGNDEPDHEDPNRSATSGPTGENLDPTEFDLNKIKSWRKPKFIPVSGARAAITMGAVALGVIGSAAIAGVGGAIITGAALGLSGYTINELGNIKEHLKAFAENRLVKRNKKKLIGMVDKINSLNASREDYLPLQLSFDENSNKILLKHEGNGPITSWPEISDEEVEYYTTPDGKTIQQYIDETFNAKPDTRKLFDKESYELDKQKYEVFKENDPTLVEPVEENYNHKVTNRRVTVRNLEYAFDVYGGIMPREERLTGSYIQYRNFDSEAALLDGASPAGVPGPAATVDRPAVQSVAPAATTRVPDAQPQGTGTSTPAGDAAPVQEDNSELPLNTDIINPANPQGDNNSADQSSNGDESTSTNEGNDQADTNTEDQEQKLDGENLDSDSENMDRDSVNLTPEQEKFVTDILKVYLNKDEEIDLNETIGTLDDDSYDNFINTLEESGHKDLIPKIRVIHQLALSQSTLANDVQQMLGGRL